MSAFSKTALYAGWPDVPPLVRRAVALAAESGFIHCCLPRTAVVPPVESALEGYDVVTFSAGTGAECSPLSCNALASELETSRHCLLPSLERAQHLLEEGRFSRSEPGPYRILAVYTTAWPGAGDDPPAGTRPART